MSMSLRLSDEAVQVSTSKYSISEEAIAALRAGDTTALLRSHHGRWASLEMMADDDPDDDNDDDEPDDPDDDDDDDDDDDLDDDQDDDDPEGKKSKKKKESQKDDGQPKTLDDAKRKIAAQQDTNDRLHRVVTKARKERDDALERVAQMEKDGVTDETVKTENSDLKSANTKLSSQLQDALLRIAFLSDDTYEWQSPAVAMKAADLSKIEILDNGDVVGMTEALQALAEKNPFLLKQKSTTKRNPNPNPNPTAKRPAKKSSTKAEQAKRDEIRRKYFKG